MKMFKVNAERIYALETLVIANNPQEAALRVLKAIRDSEIDYEGYPQDEITSASPAYISEPICKEIKDYGIINELGELSYDTQIIEKLEEETRKAAHDEYMKKYCLEFEFVKTL